ncbi:aminomethyltransferase [Tamaricihabitans halophyticus]|uniref:Aminomethyltransferase n=1 Tax=Tamaricihabitans halophyticus TaxID=1262583 RepID=A0A4R2Q5J4_9PSEU|nr:aminomethyltransferase family protein [Tamaricihabitans halophyticus]TCP43897.1 aminomethyltransferase [Tamaricihabitans halophyticus]
MTAIGMGPRLRLPGLLPREEGLETYLVRAGGVTAVRLDGGDRLTVIDLAGRQPAELTVVAAGGANGSAIGISADAPASTLRRLAAGAHPGAGAETILAALAAGGVNPEHARAVQLFGEYSPAGARETFTASQPAQILVAAPGRVMRVDEQAANPPSELLLEVRRAVTRPAAEPHLPEPLADPVLDLRIDAATARDYQVKAGQYIQVIDIEGRQCSDFLAFGAHQLDSGIERGLDSTTTRYFMGNAYPQPGLFGKFYDQDAQPLVEIVRDTVGRHDTFGLACNAKYYEDFGYPGHVNCTDNFNARLAQYGIAARKGWPALNLFYNTAFDDANLLVFDEPWSRPGDYVLMRAMTDLVCASSACPDDIDPANAWVPTDVHIRVYDAERKFSMAISHRVTPESEATLTKKTAFAPRTSALTRQQTEYRGYWLPTSFDGHGPQAEYWACRERAAVMDLSPLRKFEVLGPDAEALLQRCVTRNIRKLSTGQVVYSAMCNETGGMIDDCTVFRLADTNFRFVGGDEYDGVWLREQAERAGLDRVWVKHSTDQLHNIAVQGPASRELLRELIWTPPTQPAFMDLTWFRFAIGRLGDHNGIPLLVSRTGYSGELGYELWVHPKDGPALWDAVWAAGEPHGLLPLGLDALDMLRIESGLVFAGYDFSDQTDPFEAGIGFTVPLKSKEDDFVGREALLSRKAHPQRSLVGLELAGNEPAQHGDCVHVGRSQVGVVTSATRSPVLRKNIALCRMAVQYAELGTEVEVGKLDGHQKRIPARVVRFPFYDPDKLRPRS